MNIWVVEMLINEETWIPVGPAFLRREDARYYRNGMKIDRWREGLNAIGHRVRKYVRVEE